MQSASNYRLKLINIKGLLDVVESTMPHRFNGRRYGTVSCHHDGLGLAPHLGELTKKLESIHTRHHQIGEDDIKRFKAQSLQGRPCAFASGNLMPKNLERVHHRLPRRRMIVDH